METTTTIDNAPILIPNLEHKNFTESRFTLPIGKRITGQYKVINGLRRGKPFDYRVFVTNKNEIIYSKYVKPMKTTEVTMGADAQVSATQVNMIPSEKSKTIKNVIGSATGGILGYAIAKKQGCNMTRTVIYSSIGALAGYLIAKQYTKKSGIVVQQAK